MANYYSPSGRFSFSFIIFFIICTITIFPLLGLIYAYCIWYIPWIYFNFIITGLLGYVLGLIIGKGIIHPGKVRNGKITFIIGIIVTILCLYVHWGVWVDLVVNARKTYGSHQGSITVSNIEGNQVLYLLTHPLSLFELIGKINYYGVWSIFGATISGGFLFFIWIIEFLIVTFFSTLIPQSESDKPFCELSNKWFEEIILEGFYYISDPQGIIKDLENENNNVFDSLAKESDWSHNHHSVFKIYKSENSVYYLSIENKTAKIDKDGKTEFDSNEFLNYIQINSHIANILLKNDR